MKSSRDITIVSTKVPTAVSERYLLMLLIFMCMLTDRHKYWLYVSGATFILLSKVIKSISTWSFPSTLNVPTTGNWLSLKFFFILKLINYVLMLCGEGASIHKWHVYTFLVDGQHARVQQYFIVKLNMYKYRIIYVSLILYMFGNVHFLCYFCGMLYIFCVNTILCTFEVYIIKIILILLPGV